MGGGETGQRDERKGGSVRWRCSERRKDGQTNLTVIICQLLGADNSVEVGLHKFLDDCSKVPVG